MLHPLSFWEPEMVSGVVADEAATNLLYIETLDHVTKGNCVRIVTRDATECEVDQHHERGGG